MGSSFSNLHILKNDRVTAVSVAESLKTAAIAQGLVPCGMDEADVMFALCAPEDSKWLSISGDMLEDPEAQLEYARHLSEALGSDVLRVFCFDSDYLFLNLLNFQTGLDAWANAGCASMYGVQRRSQFAHWKGSVSDLEHFRSALRKRRTFVEEALEEVAEDLQLPAAQSCFWGDGPDGETVRLYFSAPVSEGADELPSLEWLHRDYSICKSGERLTLVVVNRGGAGRGMECIVSGTCLAELGVTMETAELSTRRSRDIHVDSIAFEPTALADGTPALRAALRNVRIPRSVSQNLPVLKRMDKEFQNSFTFQFVLRADSACLERTDNPKGILDVDIEFRPMQNPEGGVYWSNAAQRELRRRARSTLPDALKATLDE